MTLLAWNIYEISSNDHTLHGVMLRGRLRKFALEHSINLLAENAEDIENAVRFALLDQAVLDTVQVYVSTLIPDAHIALVAESIQNPVLSKLKVNDVSRYA